MRRFASFLNRFALVSILSVQAPSFAADAEANVQDSAAAQLQQTKPNVKSLDNFGNPQLVEVEKLTNSILRAEIQMMRYSTSLHATWVRPSRGKSWRVFAYKMTGSTMLNVGMSLIAGSRFQYMNNPPAASRPYLKSGHIVNMTAASILLGGTLFEAVLDKRAENRHAKKHLDLKSAVQTFLDMQNQLDGSLAKRNSLVENCPGLSPSQKEILRVDGLVLRDLRDLSVSEFQYSFSDIARLRSARDAATWTTAFGAATAAYGGSLQSLLSVADREPKQVGVAGIGFMTSGSSVIAAPMLIHWAGHHARFRARAKLESAGVTSRVIAAENFDAHRKELAELIARADSSEKQLLQALDARKTVYDLQNELLDAREETREAIDRHINKEYHERMFYSTVVGGAQVARGAQLAVAGFKYFDDATKSYPLVAAASTTYIAGSGVWTLDNIQGKLREEIARKRATTTSVHAKLLEDMDDLENMDDQMSIF